MRRKRRLLWFICFLLVLLAALAVYMRISIGPVVQSLTTSVVSNTASSVVNSAIEQQMADGEIDYAHIILLEKDVNGKITALRTNIAEVNRLKTQILSIIDQNLLDLDVTQIGIPVGSLILPEFFSGTGPHVPVRVLSVSNSEAEFRNVFMAAGINQTAHQIMLDVSICMTVLTPVGTQEVAAASSVVVAETIIVGTVPNSYLNFD